MARLWSCGFELQSVTAAVEFDSTTGTAPTISTSTVNGGGASLKFNPSAATSYLTTQFAATSATNNVYVRFYVYFTSFPTANGITIAVVRSAAAGNNLTVRCNTAGTIYLNNEQTSTQVGSTSSAMSLNTWYRIEFSYVYSTGAANAYLNGTNFATGTASTSVATDTFRLGFVDSATGTYFADDVAINDNTGSFQNTIPGAGLLLRYSPNAAGDSNTFGTQVGGTAGSANNFTRVNEVTPDNATSYNASITAASDLFQVGAVTGTLPSGSTINVVQVGGRIANITGADTTASLQFQIEQQASGTIAKSGAIIPDTLTWSTNSKSAPHNSPLTLYQDPTSMNWTTTTIASMQIGYLIDTVHTDADAVSTIWALVDYVPPSAVNATVSQVGATITVTGGTQSVSATVVVSAAIAQSHATLTLTGGTQVIKTNGIVAQSAAVVTLSAGTQSVATVNIVAISQSHASITLSGGSQGVHNTQDVQVAQLAASVMLNGGTQVLMSAQDVSITQVYVALTLTGGTQVVVSTVYVPPLWVSPSIIVSSGSKTGAVNSGENIETITSGDTIESVNSGTNNENIQSGNNTTTVQSGEKVLTL